MLDYDQPLYRPPSEAANLIIQASIGCSFNQCTFCSMYRSKSYRARPRDEVFADIAAAARERPEAHRVFLADGDAMGLAVDDLLAVLGRLGRDFPDLQRVSCYATPVNLLKKTPAELAALKAAKLRLVYLGIESGSDDILKRIKKGATQAGMIRAIGRAGEAGIKVSAMVILGLGGRRRWRDHIEGTAELINAAPMAFLSTLQLYLEEDAVGGFMKNFGEPFEFQDDAGILAELENLVAAINPPAPVIFRSNHASNCLPLAGNLPGDKGRLLAEIRAVRQGATPLRPVGQRGL
ncbi:MAG TPA: radical SAM protein [Alphaproteobacteria bacterium]|nr:radical SAM protein [Alphaproteobacteria bacterium]